MSETEALYLALTGRHSAFHKAVERNAPPAPPRRGFGTGLCECCTSFAPISRNKAVHMTCLKIAAGKITAETMRESQRGTLNGKEVFKQTLDSLEAQNR